jgi:hypothetical protein
MLTEAATTGVSIATLSELIAIFVFIAAVIGGVVTYLIRRRGSSGTTDTSEAGTLWQQSQAMFVQVTAERDKAVEQRDRLMTAQSDQVIPILSAVLATVQQLKSVLEQRDPMFAAMKEEQETMAGQVELLARRYGVLKK